MIRLRRYVLGALPLAALAAAWYGYVLRLRGADGLTATGTLAALASLLEQGYLLHAVLASIGRYLAGLVLGAAAGVAIGVALGLSATVRTMVGPSLRTLQQVSLFAWIPFLMAWLGFGETSKVAFIAIAAFFPVLVNTVRGVGGVPVELVELARVYRMKGGQTVLRVVIPAALPQIFSGFQLALIYAWLATLGAEYLLASGQGLGNVLIAAQESFDMARMTVGIVLVSAIGVALNQLAGRLELHFMRWAPR